MELEVRRFAVRDAAFASHTALEGDRLLVDRRELDALLRTDERLAGVGLDLAYPGDGTRIVHALDAIEPRDKAEGSEGGIFPGFVTPPRTCGRGATNRLDGVAVIETAELSFFAQGMGVADAVVDMSGPAAAYSPFSSTINLVVQFDFAPERTLAERDAAIRLGGLRAAQYLASAARGGRPTDVETLTLRRPDRPLPRVAYLYQVVSNAILHETFYYGQSVSPLLPALMHPNELQDGALVSANGHFACQRNPTYLHQNNPIARELYRRHGVDLDFVGVVMVPSHRLTSSEKEMIASEAVKILQLIGAEAAVISQESGGHGAVDLMLLCQLCERAGIKTVLTMNELSDPDQPDLATPAMAQEAAAVVSTGNREETVELPPAERIYGGTTLWDGRDAGGALTLLLRHVLCSTNQVGYSRLQAVAY